MVIINLYKKEVRKMFKDNKKLVTETLFIKQALKQKLSLNEFLLLLYFDNSFDSIFDINVISKTLNMSSNDILEAYGNLINKKIIKVKAEKDVFGKVIEKVSLDSFYNDMKEDTKELENQDSKANIFSVFEHDFGRTLGPMDYETINAWLDKGFSEELIIAALKDALVNGVPNLRYIDKILYEWNRKGYKSVEDINKKKNFEEEKKPLFDARLINYDWLNEK